MNTQGIVSMVIGLTVCVIIVSTILLPQISDVTDSTSESYVGSIYAPLISVVGLLAVVGIVMLAVKSYGRN